MNNGVTAWRHGGIPLHLVNEKRSEGFAKPLDNINYRHDGDLLHWRNVFI